jgi:hypothetical protein
VVGDYLDFFCTERVSNHYDVVRYSAFLLQLALFGVEDLRTAGRPKKQIYLLRQRKVHYLVGYEKTRQSRGSRFFPSCSSTDVPYEE